MNAHHEWLSKYQPDDSVVYQVWVEFENTGWEMVVADETKEGANQSFEKLYCDPATPCINGWYILEVRVVK